MSHKIALYSAYVPNPAADIAGQVFGLDKNCIFSINCGPGFRQGYEIGYLHKIKNDFGFSSLYDATIYCFNQDNSRYGKSVVLSAVGFDKESIANMINYLKDNSPATLSFTVLFLIDKKIYYRFFDNISIVLMNPSDVIFDIPSKGFPPIK